MNLATPARRFRQICILFVHAWLFGCFSAVGQATPTIELTPHEATVFMPQCSQFYGTISPPQPNTVEITIDYSDPARVSNLITNLPIYPPGVRQYFQVCGAQAGTEPITVTARLPPELGAASDSAIVHVVNGVPQIFRISPDSATAGSGPIDLYVIDWYHTFLPISRISWNGVERPTVLVYSNLCPPACGTSWLKATISAEELALPGSARVTVVTPPPGGGESAPLAFTIFPSLQTIPTLLSEALALFGLLLAAVGGLILLSR